MTSLGAGIQTNIVRHGKVRSGRSKGTGASYETSLGGTSSSLGGTNAILRRQVAQKMGANGGARKKTGIRKGRTSNRRRSDSGSPFEEPTSRPVRSGRRSSLNKSSNKTNKHFHGIQGRRQQQKSHSQRIGTQSRVHNSNQWVEAHEYEAKLTQAEYNRYVNPTQSHNFPAAQPGKILRANKSKKPSRNGFGRAARGGNREGNGRGRNTHGGSYQHHQQSSDFGGGLGGLGGGLSVGGQRIQRQGQQFSHHSTA